LTEIYGKKKKTNKLVLFYFSVIEILTAEMDPVLIMIL